MFNFNILLCLFTELLSLHGRLQHLASFPYYHLPRWQFVDWVMLLASFVYVEISFFVGFTCHVALIAETRQWSTPARVSCVALRIGGALVVSYSLAQSWGLAVAVGAALGVAVLFVLPWPRWSLLRRHVPQCELLNGANFALRALFQLHALCPCAHTHARLQQALSYSTADVLRVNGTPE